MQIQSAGQSQALGQMQQMRTRKTDESDNGQMQQTQTRKMDGSGSGQGKQYRMNATSVTAPQTTTSTSIEPSTISILA